MTESNVKLVRFMDKHLLLSVAIIFALITSSVLGLGIGMTNIGNENKQKVMNTFENLSCEKLTKIPSSYGNWLESSPLSDVENEFLNAWNKEMQRCLK